MTDKEDDPNAKKPPSYGTQEYWEERYLANIEKVDAEDGISEGANKSTTDPQKSTEEEEEEEDNSPAPFHSWYFSYDELKPLLLPLILGGREEMQVVMMASNDDGSNDESDDEIAEEMAPNPKSGSSDPTSRTNSDKQQQQQHQPQKNCKNEGEISAQTTSIQSAEDNNDSEALDPEKKKQQKKTEKEEEAVQENNDSGGESEGEGSDDNEWEEVEVGDSEGGEEEEEDQEEGERSVGLAVQGPISVLEIGCGDVPLGTALAEDLIQLERKTGAHASMIVKRIVCTDYSSTVIDIMKRLHSKKRKTETSLLPDREEKEIHQEETKEGTSESSADLPVEFVVADARELPYPDGSFHLLLEKGTLDAMLSDSEVGIDNCKKIVSDCARVLSVGGCIFLISHVNAHTINGEKWLDEVVVPGLRAGGGDSTWTIEVHGSDEPIDEDVQDIPGPPGSPGPAVYMIFKGAATPSSSSSKESSGPSTISLKFFSY